MKFITPLSVLLIIFSLSLGCSQSYGPYYGKVIDAETKEPLEGVAVLAVFYTQQYGPAGSSSHYVDAKETVTDMNGEFKIPSLTVTTFRIGHSFEPYAMFLIFKPGYGHYPDSKGIKPMFIPNGTLPEDEYITVELPKLNEEQRRKDLGPMINFSIPYDKQKHFIDLINEENKIMGISGEYTRDSFEQ
jgi:hypothetical protein